MKKESFTHCIPLYFIYSECAAETDFTGWKSGNDLSGKQGRCSNV